MKGEAGVGEPFTRMDRSFAAILCSWRVLEDATHGGPAPVRNRIEALCHAGIDVGIVGPAPDVVDRGLHARPAGPGCLHLLVPHQAYLCTTDGVEQVWHGERERASQGIVLPSADHLPAGGDGLDGARWLLGRWHRVGIGAGLVLMVGAELAALAGGLAGADRLGLVDPRPDASGVALLRVFDDQLRRRRDGRVPSVDEDRAWVLPLPYPSRAADALVQATLACLGDGRFGTRGTLEEDAADAGVQVLAAGVYAEVEGLRALLPGPFWTAVDAAIEPGGRRVLDLRTGVLWREGPGGYRSLRFASSARPGVMAMRMEHPADGFEAGDALRPSSGTGAGGWTATAPSSRGGGIVAAAEQISRQANTTTVERTACYAADPRTLPPSERIRHRLQVAREVGFEVLLREHRAAWADRWADAVVSIDGDADAELAVRFALFHLLSCAAPGEAAVGARGLSGPAYAGHVFWDADVFVMPVLAAVHPEAARAMVQYRVARLEAAHRQARARGFAGVLWPWESADDGEDVTPASARDRDGVPFPIRTSELEQHIVADVAWAAVRYAAWTGDDAFLTGPALPLVVEGARFWASRVEPDDEGRHHIRGVIGPDEYHEQVDDNAFTNVMARWHLRTAAVLAERLGAAGTEEIRRWRDVAVTLVDGYDPSRGGYEQFAGFRCLAPLLITDIAQPPVAADLLLGRGVVSRSQVVKQADVLMLHHLVPEELAPGSLRADLDHYTPWTAHGSSLSPAISAATWARAHQPDRALDVLRTALRLDLDDVTGTTAGGLHVATMGGVWQALAYGFLGLRPVGVALGIDPVLPASWEALEMAFRFRGTHVGVRAGHQRVRVRCDRPLSIVLGPTGRMVPISPPGRELRLEGSS